MALFPVTTASMFSYLHIHVCCHSGLSVGYTLPPLWVKARCVTLRVPGSLELITAMRLLFSHSPGKHSDWEGKGFSQAGCLGRE